MKKWSQTLERSILLHFRFDVQFRPGVDTTTP